MHERKLGKGLEVLFSEKSGEGEKQVHMIRPDRIRPNPSQPRKVFQEEAFLDLKRSIAADRISACGASLLRRRGPPMHRPTCPDRTTSAASARLTSPAPR